jgi:uroporphyrinogen decarboxylase
MPDVLTARERICRAIAHKEPDRVPIHDSVWAATASRWRNEGMPADIPVAEYFHFELAGFGVDISPQFPVRIIERTPDYVVKTTPYGSTRKNHWDYSTTPELLDYAIKTRQDWEEAKKRLQPSHTRVDWVTLKQTYEQATSDGLFRTFNAVVGYDLCQAYIRADELLPLLLTDPDWIRDMIETTADLVIEMAKIVMKEGYVFDAAFLYNDMGYRGAPFFSPRVYRELIQPADRRVFDYFHSRNMPVILHSCGYVKPLLPDLLAVGLDCLQPLETKAGMDLIELKSEFGKDLSFMGGIDVRTFTDPDPTVLEQEIRTKISAAKIGGGYIYHSDHSVPNNVSFQQYVRVLELVKKYGDF